MAKSNFEKEMEAKLDEVESHIDEVVRMIKDFNKNPQTSIILITVAMLILQKEFHRGRMLFVENETELEDEELKNYVYARSFGEMLWSTFPRELSIVSKIRGSARKNLERCEKEVVEEQKRIAEVLDKMAEEEEKEQCKCDECDKNECKCECKKD